VNLISSGNAIRDYIAIPADNVNWFTREIIGDWSTSGPGTLSRAPNTGATPLQHLGRPVASLVPGGGTFNLFKTFTVGAVSNARARGRYMTFALDVYFNSASQLNYSISIDDNGGGQSYSFTSGSTNALGWQLVTASGYFNSSTTAVRGIFSCLSAGEYYIANPRLVVGLDPDRMPSMSGEPVFYAASVPTVGTWAQGDVVWNSAAASGGPPGWVCTTAGTGGGALVFKAMANLA